jgi:hypothetical protein
MTYTADLAKEDKLISLIGSVAAKPVMWHTTIINLKYPLNQPTNGTNKGLEYRTSDDAHVPPLQRMHAMQLLMFFFR